MAYITKETVKNIRNALKKEFPEIKFSVRLQHHSSVDVAIMKSSLFEDGVNIGVNQYYIDKTNHSEEAKKVLKKIDEVIRTVGGHYDNSDAMTDYFDTAFYYSIEIGKWDKPHTKTSN